MPFNYHPPRRLASTQGFLMIVSVLLLCTLVMSSAFDLSSMAVSDHLATFESKFNQLITSSSFLQSSDNGKTSDITTFQQEVCGYDTINLHPISGQSFTSAVNESAPFHFALTFCALSEQEDCANAQGSLCVFDNKNNNFVSSLASFMSPANPPVYSYLVPNQPSSGISIAFRDTPGCPDEEFLNFPANVTLNVACNRDQQDPHIDVERTGPCQYAVHFASPAACPHKSPQPHRKTNGLSSGAIILITIVIALCVYFGIGIALNVIRHGASFNTSAIPHRSFWFSLPMWFFAGLAYLINKIRTMFGVSDNIVTSHGEYDQV